MLTEGTLDQEAVGLGFTDDGMLDARRRTRAVIEEIASLIHPGMVEEDAVQLAKDLLTRAGLSLSWHPTRVRFGKNTTKPMKVKSEPGVVLGPNDIFFLDVAPRYEGCEADSGKTFVVGDDPRHRQCARDAQAIFHAVRQAWLTERLSGERLYALARARAHELGWELNMDLPGHRLADFPHAAIHTGSLAQATFTPSPLRWVLEIHVKDPQGKFGAFYEDLLLEDGHYRSEEN